MKHLIYRDGRVVGQFFISDAHQRSTAENLPPDSPVQCVAEPENEHDKLAVSVRFGGAHVGYIPKEFSPAIALFLSAGYLVTGHTTGFAKKGQRNPLVRLWAVQKGGGE